MKLSFSKLSITCLSVLLVNTHTSDAQTWRTILAEDFGTGTENVSPNPAQLIAPGTSNYNISKTTVLRDGNYTVAKNANFVDDYGGSFNNQWVDGPDKSGSGYMMLINADQTKLMDLIIYSQ